MAGKQPQKRNETSIKKGEVRNPNGKKKGTLNKVTARTKATIEMVMDNLAETIIEDLSMVNASRRLQVYIDLMNYIKPKLSANKIEQEVKQETKIEVEFKPYKLNKGTNNEGAESDGN